MDKSDSKKKFLNSLLLPSVFVLIIWIIHFMQAAVDLNFYIYGIFPRKITGLMGIINAPLIHSDFPHLISNTPMLFILGIAIIYFYPGSAYRAMLAIYLLTGIFVWLFARPAYHIGASGLIYGFLGFLFFSGVFRRDNRSIALALLVTFLYGSLIWGIFPGVKEVSWEAHLFGGVAGIISAFIFRKLDPRKVYDWENEPEEPGEKIEISYDKDKNNFLS
jgi:membrane associated rhomboid family serine protease